MKQTLKILMLLVALVVPRMLWAQGELTVCNGTATNNFVPFYGYYYDEANCRTQSIYPDSLFTALRGESVYQMTWYPSSGGAGMADFTQDVTVKLGVMHTQSSFNGTYVPDDSLTTVWTGSLGDYYSDGVLSILFDSTFTYPSDGGNLVVEFTKPIATVYKQIYFYGMNTSYGASGNSYGATTSPYSRNFLAKTTLAYGTPPDCGRPGATSAVATTAYDATVSWGGVADAGSYELAIFAESFVADTVQSYETSYDTFYTFQNLAPNTFYYYAVRANCTDNSFWRYGTLRTQCAPMPTTSLPYTEDFDDYTSTGNQPLPQCWQKLQASATGENPCPYYGNAHNGNYAVSFYYGGGGTNLLAMPQFEDLDQLAVTFWAYKGNNNGVCDLFVVGVMEDDSTFVGIDTISLNTYYTEYTVPFTSYTGTGNTPAFFASSNSGDLRLTLDEVTVNFAPQCATPNSVVALSTTTTDALLTWNGDESLTYEVAYDTVTMSEAVLNSVSTESTTGTSITLTGLEANHSYHVYVRSDCGGGAYSNWTHGTFQTQRCDGGCYISIVMHDSYGDGWNSGSITVQQGADVIGTATLTSGGSGTASIYVCPTDTVFFSFATGIFPSEISFEIFDAYENDLYTSAQGALTTEGQFFYWVPGCEAPTCARPTSGTISNVTAYTADIAWVDGDPMNPVGDYMLLYGTINDPAQAIDSVACYTTSEQLTGLTPSTSYHVWVHAVCGSEVSMNRYIGSFSTSCAPYPSASLPFTENFDNLTGTGNMAWPNCWTRISGDGDNPCPNYSTDHAHSGTNSISMWTSGSNGYANCFVLPEFEEELNQLQISFWAQLWFATGVEHFVVGVMEGTTFVPVDTVALTEGYSEYTVSFADYQGNGTRPAFYAKNMSGSELRVNVDDIVVDYIPSCPRPTNVVMTDRGSTTLDLAWANDGGVSYDLFWSENANDQPSVMLTVTDTFATITGLDTNTNYYVYVRSHCADNSVSEWTIPTQMQTFLCDDPCDILVTFGSSAQWATSWNAMYIYMGGQEMAKIMGDHSSSNPVHVAICPNTPIVLARECYHSTHSSNVYCTVTTLYDEVLATMPNGTFCGASQMIYIDTFETDCQAPTCFSPLNVTASNIDSTSALITWSDDIATSWQLEYGPAGFVQGNGTVVNNLTTQSYTINNLNPNTAYDVYVAAVCSDTTMAAPVCQFRTACGVILMLPYSEDFETYSEGQLPFCWSQFHNQGSNPCVSVSSSVAHSGSRMLSFWHNQSGAQNTLASPEFNTLAGLQVTFWARTNNGVPQFSVGVIDNQGEYVPLDSTIALTATYQQYTISLDSWATFGNRVAFHTLCTSNNTQQVYIDDVTIDVIPDCPVIQSISANTSAATTTSVEIAWVDTANTAWEYIYDVTPINNAATYTPVQTTSNPLTINGLTAATTYHIYVRPVCSGVVPWAYVSTATAVCDGGCEIELVMHDSYGDGWNGASISLSQNNILMGSGTVGSGLNATERIGICPNVPIEFNFTRGNYPTECSFEINDTWGNEIYASGEGDLTTSGVFFTYTTDCSAPSCYKPTNVAASNITTTSATITWFDTLASDWVVAYSNLPFTPADLSGATQQSASTTSLTLSGLNATTTYYLYVRANCTDTSIWSDCLVFGTNCDVFPLTASSPLFESFESETAPANCWTIVDNSGSINAPSHAIPTQGAAVEGSRVFAFSSLAHASDYNQYLITPQLASAGDINIAFYYETSSSYTLGENFQVGYSASTSDVTDTNAWIWGPVTTANNTTWQLFTDTIPDSAQFIAIHYYANYQYKLYIDSLLLTTDAAGCMKPGSLSATNVDYQGATIVWNGAGSSYELAYKAANDGEFGASVPVSSNSYTLAGLQPETGYVVRVRQLCDEGMSSAWAMCSFTTDSLPCMTPEALTVDEVTGTSATLSWNAISNETSWEVRYAAQGDTASLTANATTFTVTGLFVNVTYTAWVRALCGNGTVLSDWSEPVEFTTTPCPMPSNVAADQTTNDGATISWTAPEGYNDFTLYYGITENTNNMTPVEVTGTSHTLTGLESNTTYYVSLSTRCAEGWVSDLTANVSFRTTVGINPVNDHAISLYPNPATTQVTIEGFEGEVQIVDMTGRIVLRSTDTTIDISSLTAGAYFVKLGTTVKKLVVK